MNHLTPDQVLLLVLRECAERGLVPRGYSTHPSACEHAAILLVRALDVGLPDPPPALPRGPYRGVDSPTAAYPVIESALRVVPRPPDQPRYTYRKGVARCPEWAS